MKASDFETAKGLLDERGDLCDLLASLGEGCELQVTTTSYRAPSIDVPAAAPLVAQVKAWAGGRIAAIDAELAALGVEIDAPPPETAELPESDDEDAEAKAKAAAAAA